MLEVDSMSTCFIVGIVNQSILSINALTMTTKLPHAGSQSCKQRISKHVNVPVLQGGPDQTLSETQVNDKVRWVHMGLQQVR